jgi:hypothetical protein
MMNDDQVMAATPHAELLAELMNPNTPKNEREHAAVREIERLREALAQPVQEPVAWWDAKIGVFNEKHFDQLQPLYTSPPKRQPLTDEEVEALIPQPVLRDERGRGFGGEGSWDRVQVRKFARAIEAKLKEKNT